MSPTAWRWTVMPSCASSRLRYCAFGTQDVAQQKLCAHATIGRVHGSAEIHFVVMRMRSRSVCSAASASSCAKTGIAASAASSPPAPGGLRVRRGEDRAAVLIGQDARLSCPMRRAVSTISVLSMPIKAAVPRKLWAASVHCKAWTVGLATWSGLSPVISAAQPCFWAGVHAHHAARISTLNIHPGALSRIYSWGFV